MNFLLVKMKPQSTPKHRMSVIEREDIYNLDHSYNTNRTNKNKEPSAFTSKRSSTKLLSRLKEGEDLSFLVDEEIVAADTKKKERYLNNDDAAETLDVKERLKARVAKNMKAFLLSGQGKQIQALMEEGTEEPEPIEDDEAKRKLFKPAVDGQSLQEVVQELNQKKTETLNRTIIHKCCIE